MDAAALDLTDLDYPLPAELIAQGPAARREDARLLGVDRTTGVLRDLLIPDLPALLRPGDLLVLNDTKVVPAKFLARRATGGLVKGLFLEATPDGPWEVMLESGGRLRIGETLTAMSEAQLAPIGIELSERLGQGRWRVRVDDQRRAEEILTDIGQTPLPPYIRRPSADIPRAAAPAEFEAVEPLDRERYQTVYAARPGAVAAPTAGLHFTPALLDETRARGADIAFVTLHVGLGTFKPITADQIADHVMHSERFELPAETADAVNACKTRSGRVVAIGTTTVRVLESAARNAETSKPRNVETEKVDKSKSQKVETISTARRKPADRDQGIEGSRDQGFASSLRRSVAPSLTTPIDNRQSTIDNSGTSFIPLPPCEGSTDIFIYPPYRFRVVDALLTNFHLPRSTLLALVMAFSGKDLVQQAYRHAISQRYRFYSYGDAMFVA